jgi:hypothetical protein
VIPIFNLYFTYQLEQIFPAGPGFSLAPGSNASSAFVTIETDTVSGASPYIFNISLRSVFGMQWNACRWKQGIGFPFDGCGTVHCRISTKR